MKISIDADATKPLGGKEWSPAIELRLFEDGTASIIATERHSSENATPMDEWHNRTLIWKSRLSQGSTALPDADAIAAFAEEITPLLAIVAAGHTVDWNGSKNVGRLTDAASAASDEIGAAMDCAALWSDTPIWETGEWIMGGGPSAYDALINAGVSDEVIRSASDIEIDALYEQFSNYAADDGVVLIPSGLEIIFQLARDELADDMPQ